MNTPETLEDQYTSVEIYGHTLNIKCPSDQIQALNTSAKLVDEKMREIKTHQKMVSLERTAIMTALNLAHELIESRRHNSTQVEDLTAFIASLEEKILKSVA